MGPRRRTQRNVVVVEAFDQEGRLIEKRVLSVYEYYDGICPLIDECDYRATHGIRCIKGTIYDELGLVHSRFEASYAENGAIVHGTQTRISE